MTELPGQRTTWALRLPVNLPLEDLNGCTLDSDEKCLVVNGVSYKLIPDQSFELSVVQPVDEEEVDSSDEDSEKEGDAKGSKSRKRKKDEEDGKPKSKKVETIPTDGYSLVENNLDASDAMLKTTTIDTADTFMRKAYRHVPQISGLKRRWMPSGVNWKAKAVQLDEDVVADAPYHQPFDDSWIKEEPEIEPPAKKKKRESRSSKHSSSSKKEASSSSRKASSSSKSVASSSKRSVTSSSRKSVASSSKKSSASSSVKKSASSSSAKKSSSKKSPKKESKEPKRESKEHKTSKRSSSSIKSASSKKR